MASGAKIALDNIMANLNALVDTKVADSLENIADTLFEDYQGEDNEAKSAVLFKVYEAISNQVAELRGENETDEDEDTNE